MREVVGSSPTATTKFLRRKNLEHWRLDQSRIPRCGPLSTFHFLPQKLSCCNVCDGRIAAELGFDCSYCLNAERDETSPESRNWRDRLAGSAGRMLRLLAGQTASNKNHICGAASFLATVLAGLFAAQVLVVVTP